MSSADNPSSTGRMSLTAPISSRRSPTINPPSERGPFSFGRQPMSDSVGPMALDGFALAVLRELTHHLSEPNARALLMAAASASGVPASALSPSHLPMLVSQIVKTFDVFGIGNEAKLKCLSNLNALTGSPIPATEVIPINREGDIVTTRETGKQMCLTLGFSEVACVKVATVISELARNIVKYAGDGTITLRVLTVPRRGVEIVAADHGPGIADVEAVMSPRYRSRSGMGVGLRGTRRVMDHFEIKSVVGRGTTVTTHKYQE